MDGQTVGITVFVHRGKLTEGELKTVRVNK
jgi:hypothetical protein